MQKEVVKKREDLDENNLEIKFRKKIEKIHSKNSEN